LLDDGDQLRHGRQLVRELLDGGRHAAAAQLPPTAASELPSMPTAAELCLDVGLLALQRRQAVLKYISFVCRKWSGAC
jgi:hypothetical protein